MADDIDIEEHDILDNPRVQEILPQISCIKTEPLDYQEAYDENYLGDQSEYEAGFIENLLREDEAYEPEHELDRETDHQPAQSEPSDVEPSREETTPNIPQALHRIILGSKPCPKRRKIKHLSILLEDWSERLNRSQCYCKDCKTLFATRNALDAHNMIAHSFLVALDPPLKEDPPQYNHKYCNHCQKYFQDDDKLIQHLYDLITAKQAKKDVKNDNVPLKSPVKSVVVYKRVQGEVKSVDDNVQQAVDPSVIMMMCPICRYLFKNRKRCAFHCKTKHQNTQIEPKLSIFEQKCKLCSKILSKVKSYNIHIKNQHNNLYSKKVDGTVNVVPAAPKPLLMKRSNYKCQMPLSDVHAAKTHQLIKHGNSKIVMAKNAAGAVAKPPRLHYASGLVPQNVLFKCDICPIHTLTWSAAIGHRASPHSKPKSMWKCYLCKPSNPRQFRQSDKKLHQLQHKNAKEIKVYVLHDNIYSRVLNRCPKCKIYFEERLFMRHTKYGCGMTTNVVYCDICKINVNNIAAHRFTHTVRGLIQSDFILIDDFISLSDMSVNTTAVKRKLTGDCPEEAKLAVKKKDLFYSDADNATAVKRKLTAVDTQQPKRCKVDTKECPKEVKVSGKKKILVYYCFSCVTFITQPGGRISQMTKRQKFHTLRKCKANQRKHLCKQCGLPFNSNQVMHVHVSRVHAQSNVGVKDFSFANITDLKPCTPPMPVFPMCRKCGVSYLALSSRHVCFSNSPIKCKICKKTFEKKAHKLHILHHKYIGSLASKAEVNPTKKYLPKKCPKVVEKNWEKTLKRRYQMMKPIWNILYSCKMCDVTTDHYDYVVEHCQKHYNKLESYDVTIEQCELCSLNFESDCFNRHKELHRNRTINRNSFKILQYDWFSLLTVGWMKLFDTLPNEQSSLILSRSIYVTLAVKMTLIVDGPPDYTIYECQSCTKIITADTVIFHAKNGAKCTKNGTKFKCSICNFCFATRYARDVHVTIHKKQSVPANCFRVVAFNSPHETEFNAKLLAEYTELTKIENINSLVQKNYLCQSKTVFSTATGNKYRYFQCQKCMCCVAKFSCMQSHVCKPGMSRMVCPVCKYHFRSAGANSHVLKHAKNKDFTRANIVIVPFNNEVRDKDVVRNLNKQKPQEVKECVERNAPPTPAIPSITLYRCLHCKCLFLNKQVLTTHQKNCNPSKFEGEKCNKCGLVFHKNSLGEHLENCTPSQINKHEVIGASYSDRVYKCENCNLYFMTRREVQFHLESNHLKGPLGKCGCCGWLFQHFALPKHIHYHHKPGKSMKDLTIVSVGNQLVQDEKSSQRTSQKRDANQTSVSTIDVEDHDDSNDVSFVSEQSGTCVDRPKVKPKAKPKVTEYTKYRYMAHFTDGMRKVLYKCRKCDLYYVNISSWISHCLLKHKTVRAACPCRSCHLKFPPVTLKKHMRLHHKINKDSLDPNVEIVIPEEYEASKKGSDNQTIEETPAEIATTSATDIQELDVTENVSDVSQSIACVEVTTPEPKSGKIVSSTPKEHSHKIYKCGQCNVYFMAQSTCYIHMLHHAPIDPKEYIECKLCNLPFKIMSLNIHIRKHHKAEFKLDQVLVEEYSNDGGKTPKIDIYYAADKLQSRLVSTTTVEAVDSTEDVTDLLVDKKSIVDQPDSSEVDSNENTALTDYVYMTPSTSKDVTNKLTWTDKSLANEVEMDKVKLHECSYCGEKFKSNTSKEFHESLDHLDAVKDCQFCKQSFNMSILNEIHLNIKNDSFKCCICNVRFKLREMTKHSDAHKGQKRANH